MMSLNVVVTHAIVLQLICQVHNLTGLDQDVTVYRMLRSTDALFYFYIIIIFLFSLIQRINGYGPPRTLVSSKIIVLI